MLIKKKKTCSALVFDFVILSFMRFVLKSISWCWW